MGRTRLMSGQGSSSRSGTEAATWPTSSEGIITGSAPSPDPARDA